MTIGRSLFMAKRRCYSVRLVNRSGRAVRVREFAHFDDARPGWKIATATGHWLPAPTFKAWFGVMPEITDELHQAILATF